MNTAYIIAGIIVSLLVIILIVVNVYDKKDEFTNYVTIRNVTFPIPFARTKFGTPYGISHYPLFYNKPEVVTTFRQQMYDARQGRWDDYLNQLELNKPRIS